MQSTLKSPCKEACRTAPSIHGASAKGLGHRIAARIKSGTVGINMPYTAFPGIPFGGYKQSGFGRELGLETLDAYLETKQININLAPQRLHWFSGLK